MNGVISIGTIFLSAVGLIAAFYYVVGAFINLGVGIHRLNGYERISAVPFVPLITGMVAGLIASIYFRWVSIWLAVSLAILPDLVYILCEIILGLRVKRGFVPKDREPSIPDGELEVGCK